MDSLQFRPAIVKPTTRRRRKFTSIAQRKRKCDFCPSTEASYTCSHCDLPFCSTTCFRSKRHSECSELFYKKCVLEHLKHTRTDKAEQSRFLDLLKRNSDATNEDIVDYLDLLQSEDLDTINLNLLADPRLQQFSEKLTDRLQSADDLEKIWFELNSSEQAEFIEIVNGNEKLFNELISEWMPWWRRKEWQQTVQEDDDHQEDEDQDSRPFPAFFTEFERISKLTSKTPSPTIGISLICTIFAYCHLTRLYNGEIACSDPQEPLQDDDTRWSPDIALEFFRLCPLLDASSVALENPSQALELSLSSLLSSSEAVALEQKQLAIELLQDLQIIFNFRDVPGRVLVIQEPSSVLHAPKAILLILSDLIHIFNRIQGHLKKSAKSLFKRLELAKRKLQFYLSWTVEYGEAILGSDQILQSIGLEIAKLNQENLLFEQEREEVIVEEDQPKTSKKVHFKGPLIEEIN